MPLPRAVARFNKRVSNRFIEPIARLSPGFAVVHHVGRKSGRSFTTPVNAFRADGAFIIALTYGPSADWVENVVAGGGRLEMRGMSNAIQSAELVGRAVAWPHLPHLVKLALRLLQVHHFCRVSLAG